MDKSTLITVLIVAISLISNYFTYTSPFVTTAPVAPLGELVQHIPLPIDDAQSVAKNPYHRPLYYLIGFFASIAAGQLFYLKYNRILPSSLRSLLTPFSLNDKHNIDELVSNNLQTAQHDPASPSVPSSPDSSSELDATLIQSSPSLHGICNTAEPNPLGVPLRHLVIPQATITPVQTPTSQFQVEATTNGAAGNQAHTEAPAQIKQLKSQVGYLTSNVKDLEADNRRKHRLLVESELKLSALRDEHSGCVKWSVHEQKVLAQQEAATQQKSEALNSRAEAPVLAQNRAQRRLNEKRPNLQRALDHIPPVRRPKHAHATTVNQSSPHSASADQQLAAKDAIIAKLQQDLAALRTQTSRPSTSADHTTLTLKVASLQAQLAKMEKEMTSERAARTQSLQSQIAEVAGLKTQLAEMDEHRKNDAAQSSQALLAANEKLSQRDAYMHRAEQRVVELTTMINESKEKHESIQKEQSEKLKKCLEERDALQSQLEIAERTAVAMKTELDRIQSQLAAANTEGARLETYLSGVNELQSQHAMAVAEIQSLRAGAGQQQMAQQTVAALQSQLEQQSSMIASLQDGHSTLNRDLDQARNVSSALQANNKQLSNELQSRDRVNTSLRAQLKNAQLGDGLKEAQDKLAAVKAQHAHHLGLLGQEHRQEMEKYDAQVKGRFEWEVRMAVQRRIRELEAASSAGGGPTQVPVAPPPQGQSSSTVVESVATSQEPRRAIRSMPPPSIIPTRPNASSMQPMMTGASRPNAPTPSQSLPKKDSAASMNSILAGLGVPISAPATAPQRKSNFLSKVPPPPQLTPAEVFAKIEAEARMNKTTKQ